MEAIRQVVKTPRNHEIRIKIPQYIPENDLVEIILIVMKKHHDFERKINELKSAMNDELFLSDLEEVSAEFESIDLAEWEQ
jgi:hypothetical protein